MAFSEPTELREWVRQPPPRGLGWHWRVAVLLKARECNSSAVRGRRHRKARQKVFDHLNLHPPVLKPPRARPAWMPPKRQFYEEEQELWGEWEETREHLENEDGWAAVFHAAVAQGRSGDFLRFQDLCLEGAAQKVRMRATDLLKALGAYAIKALQNRGSKVSGRVASNTGVVEKERTVLIADDFATTFVDLSTGDIVARSGFRFVDVTVSEIIDRDASAPAPSETATTEPPQAATATDASAAPGNSSDEIEQQQLREWIFTRDYRNAGGKWSVYADLLNLAHRHDSGLKVFANTAFKAAYQAVYVTKANRSPAGGWAFREPYYSRLMEVGKKTKS